MTDEVVRVPVACDDDPLVHMGIGIADGSGKPLSICPALNSSYQTCRARAAPEDTAFPTCLWCAALELATGTVMRWRRQDA